MFNIGCCMIKKFYEKHKKFIIYIVFSVVISGINIGVYYISYNYIYSNILFSNIIAYTVSFVIQFITSRRIIFKSSKDRMPSKVSKFIIMKIIAMLLDSLVLYLLKDCLGVRNLIAKIISNCSTAISNYWLSNNWVFKDK